MINIFFLRYAIDKQFVLAIIAMLLLTFWQEERHEY